MFDIDLDYLSGTRFKELYCKLLLQEDLIEVQKSALLELAVIFLNSVDDATQKLGYKIILSYANQYNDYRPLYDIGINKNHVPVSKFIERKHLVLGEESFFQDFLIAFQENFKVGNIYLTSEQLRVRNKFISEDVEKNLVLVAPTSYGKSELIFSRLAGGHANTCIIVPTKALVGQTKKRLLETNLVAKKIITHPEMYEVGDTDLLCVLTQERLLRLLRVNQNLKFDLVFIDEAHNLLEKGVRNELLAASLIVLQKRNLNVQFKFLTPFLVNQGNLKVSFTDYQLEELRVKEYVKSETFFYCDFLNGGSVEIYDQFLNEFIMAPDSPHLDEIDFILNMRTKKNIVYINRPKYIESVARQLAVKLPVSPSLDIKRACAALAEYVHKDYLLISCLQKGLLYHHGQVPDNIKSYLEYIFGKIDEIFFILCSSTLLEGVNIPAEKLFILDSTKGPTKLSQAQLKNLVGRVCRFSEVFNLEKGELKMLEPQIFLLRTESMDKRVNAKELLRSAVNIRALIKEKPENVLLANTKINKKNRIRKELAEQFVENFENGSLRGKLVKHATTDFGKACFVNAVSEINILECEGQCQKIVDELLALGQVADTAEAIIDFISKVFVPFLNKDEGNLKRFETEGARKFYSKFLRWRVDNVSFSEMIGQFVWYWKQDFQRDGLAYVGKWGDTIKAERNNYHWIVTRSKSDAELVNFAIVRIKEEQDLVDNSIVKLIEVLFELKLVSSGMYDEVKFRSTDPREILMAKAGFSKGLSAMLLRNYSSFVTFDYAKNEAIIDPRVKAEMIKNQENDILVFELSCNIRS